MLPKRWTVQSAKVGFSVIETAFNWQARKMQGLRGVETDYFFPPLLLLGALEGGLEGAPLPVGG